VTDFGAAFDRERSAWRAGHGGDEECGDPIEGYEGERLRWAWEEADFDLSELWDHYSRLLAPCPCCSLGCIAESGYRRGSARYVGGTGCSLGFWP
jgi:hypothetical protein